MKKGILFLSCFISLLSSCNNDSDILSLNEEYKLQTKSFVNEADLQIINYNNENCLQFKNDSIFKKVLTEIIDMSDLEKNNLFSGYDFTNQVDLMNKAEEEQEAIVDNYEKDLAQAFPHEQIESFKQKYDDVFLFNPYDSTDFIPNYKISRYRYFANRQGVFLIGDSVVSVPEYTTEDIYGSAITTFGSNEHTDINSINKAETKYQIPNGDYVKARVLAEFVGMGHDNLYRDLYLFGFELLSQKKKVLWKRHHADLYLTYTLNGYGYDGLLEFIANGKKIAIYGQEEPERHIMGAVAHSAGFYRLNGTLEVWTNEIPIKGYTTIKLSQYIDYNK